MGKNDPFDPGYFGPSDDVITNQQNENMNDGYPHGGVEAGGGGFGQGQPSGGVEGGPVYVRTRVRRPGFDAGSILTPILFLVIHILVASVVQMVALFVLGIMDPSFMNALEAGNSRQLLEASERLLYGNFPLIASVYSVVQITIYALFLRFRGRRERYYTLTRAGRPLDWLSSFVMIIGCMGLAILWMMLLGFLASLNPAVNDMLSGYTELTESSIGGNLLLLTLGVVILVPIAEELLFRGIILAEMRRIMSPWLAIILNGLLFAIFHGNLVQGVYAFVAGMVLAAAYIWSESIYIPIVMHMVYNFVGSVLPQMVAGNETAGFVITVVEIAFFVLAIFAGVFFYRHRRQPSLRPVPVGVENWAGGSVGGSVGGSGSGAGADSGSGA